MSLSTSFRFGSCTLLFAAAIMLGLVSPIVSFQSPCTQDSDCSNGQGICTTVGSDQYCSCLSGFGGDDCSSLPALSCESSFANVSSTSTSFQPTATLSYLYPNLTLEIVAPLEESSFLFPALNDSLNEVPYSQELTIVFGNGSFPECDFPNNAVNWRDLSAVDGDCTDRYILDLAFSDAKTKCGFADTDGNRVFQQDIYINRRYVLGSLRGQPVERTDTAVKTLKVIFPLEVNVSVATVQVVGPPSLLAAITSVDFDPNATPEKWTVKTTTSIQSPFKLTNPMVISSTGEINSEDRFDAGSEIISTISGCGTNTQDCFQVVTLDFGQGASSDGCKALQGDITVQMNLTCSEGPGSDCPLLGGETVQVTLSLSTADACPVTEQITFSTTTLSPFSDSVALTPRTSFMTNQVAYFGAVVQSSDAQITARRIKSGSVCFQIGSQTCQPVQYDLLSPSNGKEPVFSVDFSNANNSAVFNFLNAVDATSQIFSVRATIEVDFSDASSKKKGFRSKKSQSTANQSVDLVTNVSLESPLNGSSSLGIKDVVPNLMVLLLSGIALVFTQH